MRIREREGEVLRDVGEKLTVFWLEGRDEMRKRVARKMEGTMARRAMMEGEEKRRRYLNEVIRGGRAARAGVMIRSRIETGDESTAGP